MATGSAQHSPTKAVDGLFDEKPESPILPPQQDHRTISSLSLEKMEEHQGSLPKSRPIKTPEPRASKDRINSHKDLAERSPSTPGHLAPFDWDEFETRFDEALTKANGDEQELLKEFENLVKYFNVWASAASVHDAERGVKRLQTRERYVKIAEQSLSQKKKHLTEVVRAFQSALALLNQPEAEPDSES
ncbi:hypothetical protein QBC34DRAFT_140539 [Podospora aff. communis PSN243]|uniref:Extracellular mutant protein 11 C-terminal domain-containing protein n=1 Tax=Podospora aff. communis PSN243 TaxID=3040156 RepID=A0AAV9H471_9PEZI|nr:hypothetical protein QBC34DRAFT_140539 [Podospora aff. communis PSN243]